MPAKVSEAVRYDPIAFSRILHRKTCKAEAKFVKVENVQTLAIRHFRLQALIIRRIIPNLQV